jgi:polysaccharide biosynthesis transport protein
MLIQSTEHSQAAAPSDTTTVKDALDFLRRRIWLCLFVGAAIFLAAVLLAFRLPPVYLSQATILIEQPAIPDEIIPSTIRSYVDEQIQIVAQRVYTQDSVAEIIEKFDLFPEERKSETMELTVERFIAATHLESLTADVTDDRGRAAATTFAFVVGFRYNSPEVAQQVAEEVTQRFLDENLRSRMQRASSTTNFLEQEAERLAKEISEMEVKLAEFKDQYGTALPDQVNVSKELLSRTEEDLNETEQELRDLRSERAIYQSELATLDPYATIFSETGEPIFSAEQRLAELRQLYLQYRSRYGPEHPDVVRTKREIDAIVQGGNVSDSLGNVAEQRQALEMQRDSLLERYSPEHPDVVRLQRAIEALPEDDGSDQTAPPPREPNNPAYLQAQARLESVQAGIASLERRRVDLIERRDNLQRSVTIAPRVEQEWLQVNRGYNSARLEYEEIKRRITGARLAERLETENKGERFTLLKRAGLPTVPVEPNRPAIIFLGFVLAMGVGIGLAALVDALDSSIRSVRDLQSTFGLKPVGVIPYIRTGHDRRMSWLKRSTAAGAAAISLFLVVALI